MLVIFRVAVVATLLGIFSGCSRSKEGKILGRWRAEDDENVYEMLCQKDHTYVSWTSFKKVLSTPGVLFAVGQWRFDGRELTVHYTAGNTGEKDKTESFTLLKVSGDALLMKNVDYSNGLPFKRFMDDLTFAPMKRAPMDSDCVGTWRVHYNTHDYEQCFEKDHSTVTSFRLNGQIEEVDSGTWHIEGNDLIMDIETNVDHEHRSVRWEITGFLPDRIAIKEGSVPYILERLKRL